MPRQPVALPPVVGWRGLNQKRLANGDPRDTTSLRNVNVRNGVVEGRKGLNEWDGITATATNIIGLMPHYSASSGASSLLRMTAAAVHKWNSGTSAWDDISGSALNGTSTTRPQHCQVAELNYLAFTNEGLDRPRKYTGSGNTAVWGGTPPYCKTLEYYVGFLALGNISTDGVTFSPHDIIFSDDPDNTWTECSSTEVFVTTLTLDESPGELRALKVLGVSLFAYKADAIVNIRFTGGPLRFQRQKMSFPLGILAPLSLQSLGEQGHIFLATDRNLYINNGSQVVPLPNNVQTILQSTLAASTAPYCRSLVDTTTETYMLFYKRSGSTNLDAAIAYNYRTGEWTDHVYAPEFIAALGYKQTVNTDMVRVAASSTLVYQLETGQDDNGTAVSRYHDIDWTLLNGPGNKWVTGGEFTFEKARDCRVKISLAVDRSSKFIHAKMFDLRGDDPDEAYVRVSYEIPSPVFGTWFKFRVEMFHDGSTNVCKLVDFTPEVIPVNPAQQDTPGQPQVVKV
jgi:hypothetical protein